MFSNCKKGDRVFDYTLQEYGFVSYVYPDLIYCLEVEFSDTVHFYTKDGLADLKNKVPTLFWEEVKPITPPKKTVKIEKQRAIKLRAWDVKNNVMIYNSTRDIAFNGTVKGSEEQFILLQFTGVTDKSGVGIYEGDILDNGIQKVIVSWDKWTSRFALRRLTTRVKFIIKLTYYNSYTVIGNIYENKDLIED